MLIRNVRIASMLPSDSPYGSIADGIVGVRGDIIEWVGSADHEPEAMVASAVRVIDGEGRWMTPGLIDCHTHLVFGGNRANEFEMRLAGATYEEIARAGGGIISTVTATRTASEQSLFSSAELRLKEMMRHGVTTVEIKSGYGLDVETELRMLRVARQLGERLPITVSTTLLGAHAVPPEFKTNRAGYVDLVCGEMIERAATAGLVDAVDAFCEGIAFTVDECARVFRAAQARGLPVRLHADQLSDSGGAFLAAASAARSADHVEYTSETGAKAMAGAGTTAVLLPGAYLFLAEKKKPPVATFREYGVPMAVASDMNPGSSPVGSPLVAMNLACVLFGLTPEEALAGMTRNAAPVLGMRSQVGVIAPGARADLALWDVDHPAELSYWLGGNPCQVVIRGGEVVHTAPAT